LEGVRLNEENTCSSKKLNDFFSEGEEIEVSRKKKEKKISSHEMLKCNTC